jgi:hypothetical protein
MVTLMSSRSFPSRMLDKPFFALCERLVPRNPHLFCNIVSKLSSVLLLLPIEFFWFVEHVSRKWTVVMSQFLLKLSRASQVIPKSMYLHVYIQSAFKDFWEHTRGALLLHRFSLVEVINDDAFPGNLGDFNMITPAEFRALVKGRPFYQLVRDLLDKLRSTCSL